MTPPLSDLFQYSSQNVPLITYGFIAITTATLGTLLWLDISNSSSTNNININEENPIINNLSNAASYLTEPQQTQQGGQKYIKTRRKYKQPSKSKTRHH
jgi:hypothetical protein